MKKEITIDDLTGIETDEAAEIQGMFGEETFSLDLTAESRDALLTLFRDRDSEPLRNLLSPVIEATEVKPTKPTKPTTKPDNNEPTGKQVNAWLKSVGRADEVHAGKVSNEHMKEYLAAHGK